MVPMIYWINWGLMILSDCESKQTCIDYVCFLAQFVGVSSLPSCCHYHRPLNKPAIKITTLLLNSCKQMFTSDPIEYLCYFVLIS